MVMPSASRSRISSGWAGICDDGSAVEDLHIPVAQASGRPGAVHGDVAAADDGDPPADPGGHSVSRRAEKVETVDHPGGILALEPEAETALSAEGDDDIVEASSEEVLQAEVAADPNAVLNGRTRGR